MSIKTENMKNFLGTITMYLLDSFAQMEQADSFSMNIRPLNPQHPQAPADVVITTRYGGFDLSRVFSVQQINDALDEGALAALEAGRIVGMLHKKVKETHKPAPLAHITVESFGGGFIAADYSGKRGKFGAAFMGTDRMWRDQPTGMNPFSTEEEAREAAEGVA